MRRRWALVAVAVAVTVVFTALLGGPDSQLIGTVIERQFKSANDWPFGAALSFLLMYLTFFTLALRALLRQPGSASEAR